MFYMICWWALKSGKLGKRWQSFVLKSLIIRILELWVYISALPLLILAPWARYLPLWTSVFSVWSREACWEDKWENVLSQRMPHGITFNKHFILMNIIITNIISFSSSSSFSFTITIHMIQLLKSFGGNSPCKWWILLPSEVHEFWVLPSPF